MWDDHDGIFFLAMLVLLLLQQDTARFNHTTSTREHQASAELLRIKSDPTQELTLVLP